MLGAIVGDIAGSALVLRPVRTEEFTLFPQGATFTEDAVLTVATADALLRGRDYREAYRAWGRRHSDQECVGRLRAGRRDPYGCLVPGSAVRVGPIGWAFATLQTVLAEAERSAAVIDQAPESVRGAQAAAGCVFLARNGASKAELRAFLGGMIGYRMDRTVAESRSTGSCEASSRKGVPGALSAFLESRGFEDAVRKAVSLGGDAAAQAAIAGAIAEAFYRGVPEGLARQTLARLTPEMRVIAARFADRFGEEAGAGGPRRRNRPERSRVPLDPARNVGGESL